VFPSSPDCYLATAESMAKVGARQQCRRALPAKAVLICFLQQEDEMIALRQIQ